MTERERILEKINKLRAMAENGLEHEADNARRIMDKLMRDYNIGDDELSVEKEEVRFVTVRDTVQFDLLLQIAAVKCGITKILYFGRDAHKSKTKTRGAAARNFRKKADHPRNTNTVMICTNSQFIELMTTFNILSTSYDRHMEAMTYAFLNVNGLLAPASDPNCESRKFSDEELRLFAKMQLAVEKENIHKAIERQ